MKKASKIFISAGEYSGDLLAADLVLALKERLPKASFSGIAGEAMIRAGVHPVAEMSEVGFMGLWDVLKNAGQLVTLEKRLLAYVERTRPDLIILVDFPGLHIRLAEQFRMLGLRVVQYVAPKLWAWGESRIERVRAAFDMVLGILPFEDDFFVKRGVDYRYVGSPLVDRVSKVMVTRQHLGLPEDHIVLACLPGSRRSELQYMLRTMVGVRPHLSKRVDNLIVVVPVAPSIAMEDLADMVNSLGIGPLVKDTGGLLGSVQEHYVAGHVHFVRGMSLEIMAMADVALVASGTATLECALLGTPLAIVYVMDPVTYRFAKSVVKLPYISLVNLMIGEPCVREFIQNFDFDTIAEELETLLNETETRKLMLEKFRNMRLNLKGDAPLNAADILVNAYF